jgi:iron-sulfur cluster assembly protein
MITLTPSAAKQIRDSAKQQQTEGMALRLAATRQPDGSLHYAMGFDDVGGEDDTRFASEGIDVVVSTSSLPLLEDTVVDYVELEPGERRFIFLNPNDPNYSPPTGSGTVGT